VDEIEIGAEITDVDDGEIRVCGGATAGGGGCGADKKFTCSDGSVSAFRLHIIIDFSNKNISISLFVSFSFSLFTMLDLLFAALFTLLICN